MKLHVGERIALMKILPKEGNYVTFKILIELKSALSFTEAEHKLYKMIEKNGIISWGSSKEKDINIGDKASEIICQALKVLDETGKIDANTFGLYEKFVVKGKQTK
jgi:hypothetical protein